MLYCDVTGVSDVLSCTVNQGHSSSTSTALIEAYSPTLEIGDEITIDMGTTSSHQQVFTGYVKMIERRVPTNTYTISASDKMIRAIDYFIASTNPDNPLKYRNISAESLVQSLMGVAGLSSFTYDTTYFTFGISSDFEVNLVSPYDYSNNIANLLTWSLWCDSSGTVHFENRKPFVMSGASGQPGDTVDETALATSYTVGDGAFDIAYGESEKDLRNRIVVYGNSGVYAEASAVSPYLPPGFYKSAVLAAPGLIDSNSVAQTTADYNLSLLNRLSRYVVATVEGNPSLAARQIVKVNSSLLGITNTNYYVFSCTHTLNRAGYTTALELRK